MSCQFQKKLDCCEMKGLGEEAAQGVWFLPGDRSGELDLPLSLTSGGQQLGGGTQAPRERANQSVSLPLFLPLSFPLSLSPFFPPSLFLSLLLPLSFSSPFSVSVSLSTDPSCRALSGHTPSICCPEG